MTDQSASFPDSVATSVNPSSAPKKKGKTGLCLIVGCLVLVLCSVITVIALCVGATVMPMQFAQMFVSDKPLEMTEYPEWTTAEQEALTQKVSASVANGEPITLTAEELTQYFKSEGDDTTKIRLDITSDDKVEGTIVSQLEEGKYLNIHFIGNLEIQNGMFTTMLVDELKIGSFDLGSFLKGQDLSTNVNQNIQQDPDASKTFENVESLKIQDGKVIIQLKGDILNDIQPDNVDLNNLDMNNLN